MHASVGFPFHVSLAQVSFFMNSLCLEACDSFSFGSCLKACLSLFFWIFSLWLPFSPLALRLNQICATSLTRYARELIEAKVSRSFDEMMEIDYGGDDFHDPTTNVRRRCALAIAKPTPRGYWSRGCTINLTTKVNSCKQSKEQARTKNCNLDIANIRWMIDESLGFQCGLGLVGWDKWRTRSCDGG